MGRGVKPAVRNVYCDLLKVSTKTGHSHLTCKCHLPAPDPVLHVTDGHGPWVHRRPAQHL